jgi:hypothetical protein
MVRDGEKGSVLRMGKRKGLMVGIRGERLMVE